MNKYEDYLNNKDTRSKLNQWWNGKCTLLGWIWLGLFCMLIIASIMGV